MASTYFNCAWLAQLRGCQGLCALIGFVFGQVFNREINWSSLFPFWSQQQNTNTTPLIHGTDFIALPILLLDTYLYYTTFIMERKIFIQFINPSMMQRIFLMERNILQYDNDIQYIYLYVPLISRKVSVLLGANSAAKNLKMSARHHLDSSIYSYTGGHGI